MRANPIVSITGGKTNYQLLTLEFLKTDPLKYEIGKIAAWLNLIKKGSKPRRWNKPTSKGTGMTFIQLTTGKEVEQAASELQAYIKEINEKHGCELTLVANDEE